MKVDELSGLLRLSEASFASEQAKLGALQRDEVAIRTQLRDLIKSRDHAATQPRAKDEAALRAGADMRWHRWIDTRRTTLNQELAQVIARRQLQFEKVKRAFGRKQALEKLLARANAEAKQQSLRRADQTS